MKTQTPYQIDCFTTLAELDALEKEWSDLIDEIPDVSVFQTWEWIRTWWFYFGQGRHLWLLTARDEQGKLLGLAPLMREEYKKGLIKQGIIAFIGTGLVCPTQLKILARISDMEGLYRAFLGFLMDQSDQWDVLRIGSITLDSPEYNLLKAAGGCIYIGGQTTSLFIPLSDSWESFLKTIGRNLRHNIKHYRTKLEDDNPGVVNFTSVTDPQELDNSMERLEELIRDRCHAQKLPTAYDDPTFTSFHRAVAHLALIRGWLRLYTITVRDRAIALLYSFRFKDCAYGYNAGFDVDWRVYSPGCLLLAHSIHMSIQEGASELNLGRGEADYKFSWTDHVRVENDILFSSNWRGDLWIKIGNFERGLKIKAKQLLPDQPN
jgi:CelD/BcsL family acetyltransferase involved in cellulose biosynthesis